MEGDKCPVVEEWMEMEELVSRASKGTIALVRKNTIDRDTVSDNYEMLAPILTNFGIQSVFHLFHLCAMWHVYSTM